MSIRFARGDTFNFLAEIEVNVRNEEGELEQVLDLTGWTGAAAIRQKTGRLIAELVFTWVDASALTATLTFDGDTSSWKDGPALINITMTSPEDEVKSTEPAEIVIWAPPTNG